ncbi:MAG: hypothetical protein QOG67_329 [Verrucomicrobiota bacterium]|jgi:hypothetical protein
MGDNSLVNLGDLSKPATVLVEKISDAIGGIFRPHQIVRVAKAEAEADRIRAEGQIEISDLQRRAFHRFLQEEAMRQNNIEQITWDALPQLTDQAKPDQIEDDWISNFFDKCRLISDDEMQRLWSSVLAGEANAPGAFSKRTVNFLSDLDKTDAEQFTQLCGFGWDLAKGTIFPLIYDPQNSIYTSTGVDFKSLTHLESIGLVRFDPVSGFQITKLPQQFMVRYFDRPAFLHLPNQADNSLDVGKVMLTKVGQELAVISGRHPAKGFFDFVHEKWKTSGYIKEADASQAPKEVSIVTPPSN